MQLNRTGLLQPEHGLTAYCSKNPPCLGPRRHPRPGVSHLNAGKAFFRDGKRIVNYSDAFGKHIRRFGLRWSRKSPCHLEIVGI